MTSFNVNWEIVDDLLTDGSAIKDVYWLSRNTVKSF